jgi:hypothetical protein
MPDAASGGLDPSLLSPLASEVSRRQAPRVRTAIARTSVPGQHLAARAPFAPSVATLA